MQHTFLCALLLVSLTATAQPPVFTMDQVVPNNALNRPWDLHYGPDDQLWVTERERGCVLRIDPVTGGITELLRISGLYADGRQDGLLGMALHEDLLGDSPYVYVAYTYRIAPEPELRLVRYTFSESNGNGRLRDPLVLIDGLPASNDHNSGRLVFGPDRKLYYTIGDQGGNQNRNYCNPILSQVLPTQAEVDARDWRHYPGKVLRLNLDGSIPGDNPVIGGVRSHVFTYGHRNAQGLVFGRDGQLYADEHGPDTDDEVNLIRAGANYGWPRVVGFRDNQAYDYCNWSSLDNCADFTYDKFSCPGGATFLEESTLTDSNYREPLFSLFAVTDDYDFDDPRCSNSYMCRPNVAPSSLGIYESDAIATWDNSLLVVSLKRGRVYRLQLDATGTAIVGDTTQHFYTQNRYRDIAVAPDGQSFYLITDQQGNTSDITGTQLRTTLRNPGSILRFSIDPSTSAGQPATSAAPLQLRPNPARDHLWVDLDLPTGTTDPEGTLIDPAGRVVSLPNDWQRGPNRIDLSNLPAGVYTFRLSAGGQSWVRRVVVR